PVDGAQRRSHRRPGARPHRRAGDARGAAGAQRRLPQAARSPIRGARRRRVSMADTGRLTVRRRILAALAAVAPRLLRPLLRLLQATLRVEYVGAEDLRAAWQRGER